MELFHYHHWTNLVEETEKFYTEQGFEVAGRFAKVKEGIKTYHPPLSWDDFREENPRFRIIEVRKGKINVTFGEGKKPMFDHIGFLVTKEEHDEICSRASKLGWHVDKGARRTFIGTPIRLRIELQQRDDAVGEGRDCITSMFISVKDLNDVKDFSALLGEQDAELQFIKANELALKEVFMKGQKNSIVTDPNGVKIHFKEMS